MLDPVEGGVLLNEDWIDRVYLDEASSYVV